MVGTRFEKDPIFEYPVDDRLVKRLKVSPTINAKILRNAIRSHFQLELPDALDLSALIDRYVLLLQGKEIVESLKENLLSSTTPKPSVVRPNAMPSKSDFARTTLKEDSNIRVKRPQSTSEYNSVIEPRVPFSVSQSHVRKSEIGTEPCRIKQAPRTTYGDISVQEAAVKSPHAFSDSRAVSMEKISSIVHQGVVQNASNPSDYISAEPAVDTVVTPTAQHMAAVVESSDKHESSGFGYKTWLVLIGVVVFAVFAANCRIEVHPSSFLSISDGPIDVQSPSSSALISANHQTVLDGPTVYIKLDPLAEAEAFVNGPAPSPALSPAAAAASAALTAPRSTQRLTLLTLMSAAGKQMFLAVVSILAKAGAKVVAAAAAAAEPVLERLRDPRSWSYVLRLVGSDVQQLALIPPAAA